jgi:hypothetical protein
MMAERRQLFNGRDLDGWEHVGPGGFEVQDGLLLARGGMGLLWYTRETFGDVLLGVSYRLSRREDNSGVFIRISEPPPDPWLAVHHGYEVQILDTAPDAYHRTGSIYSLAPAGIAPRRPVGEWNELRVRMQGPLVAVSVNGVETTRFDPAGPVPERAQQWEPERGPRPERGYIGLQNHDGPSAVAFREVWVEPLAAS